LVYNALYQISEQSRLSQETRCLHIAALAIEWVESCHEDTVASTDIMANDGELFLDDNQAEMEGLVAYYLDWANMDAATTDSVDALLNGFWQRYVADDDYAQALVVLNVTTAHSFSEIKKSYRRLAMVHHPDKGGNASSFQQIQWAFSLVQRRLHGQ
jgi:DnaJ-domain-containing protein 1